MDILWTFALECDYKEYDRELVVHFIHGLDDESMKSEILKEASVVENINDVTSERLLLWG